MLSIFGRGFDAAEKMGLLHAIKREGYNIKELRLISGSGRRADQNHLPECQTLQRRSPRKSLGGEKCGLATSLAVFSDRDACNGATRVRRDPIRAFDLQNPGIGQLQADYFPHTRGSFPSMS